MHKLLDDLTTEETRTRLSKLLDELSTGETKARLHELIDRIDETEVRNALADLEQIRQFVDKLNDARTLTLITAVCAAAVRLFSARARPAS